MKVEIDSITVERINFKGKEYIDIRKYYTVNGKSYPTKKGIAVHIDQAAEVIAAMGRLLDPKQLTPIINEFESIEQGELV